MKLGKILCLSIVLLSFTTLSAQEVEETESETLPCDLDFAKLLVEQQVSDGKNTQDTGKRVKILIGAADFLWDFDEEIAREHLATAFEVAVKRFSKLGFERKKYGSIKGQDLTKAMPDHRLEVIRAIAKKDRPWADRLVKKLLKEYEENVDDRKGTMNNVAEANILMSLAFDVIKTNPELSLTLFRQAMNYELDRHWFWKLYPLLRQDSNLANQVFGEALNAYRNELPSDLLFLSAYPFARGMFFGPGRMAFSLRVPTNYVPNEQLQRQFVNIFLTRSERLIENPIELSAVSAKGQLAEIAYVVGALNEMEPFVLQSLPDLATRFRLVKSKANASINEETRKNLNKKEEEFANAIRSFAALLKRVEVAHEKGTLTDQQIVDMAITAKVEADFIKAEPWIGKIKSKKGRDDLTGYLFYKRADLAVKTKRLEDAATFAKKVTNIEQKAVISFKIAAAKVKKTKQSNDVELILLEVFRLAQKIESPATKVKILLGLANAFENVNHLYALDELSNAIKVINKQENPEFITEAIPQSFVGNGYEFFTLLFVQGSNIESTFEKISKNDFQLSLAHAQSLDDPYFKTLAVLKVAKNCVKDVPKRNDKSH